MNFPSYLTCTEPLTENTFGLGYNYSALDLLENVHKTKYLENSEYNSIYNYIINNNNNKLEEINKIVRNILNAITYKMLINIQRNIHTHYKGRLYYHYKLGEKYFYNTMSPFHPNASKNELHTYSKLLDEFIDKDNLSNLSLEELRINAIKSMINTEIPNFTLDNININDNIYFDFSGSMAFFDEEWENEFKSNKDKIKGVVVMGSIYSWIKAETIGPLTDILNRLTCSTMNQLYHPKNTARFYEFISDKNIFIVPNNQVKLLNDYNSDNFLTVTLNQFLENNNINNIPLYEYAKMYYTAARPSDRKPFDYYSALLLCNIISSLYVNVNTGNVNETGNVNVNETGTVINLYYDDNYGISLLNLDINFITDKYYPEIPKNIKQSLEEELKIIELTTLKHITVKYCTIVNNDNTIEIIL